MTVDVANESAWEGYEESLVGQAEFVLRRLRIHPQAELSLVLVDEDAMALLHERWMDEPGPTDVLSFPMDELRPPSEQETADPGLLGDVVICPAVASKQAGVAGHSQRDELGVLLTHGILHLLGYDHAEPDEERLMFGLQGQLVAEWNRQLAAEASALENPP
ncbi:MAG: rRNA maturation RNase YbeY [Actinobacteria bacterium]|nr:rRNA maturation RNase YbeY [Actinomycetota bacterium]